MAEVFADLRPAQWSKLIFNATVNSVAALTGLPHDAHFAAEESPDDLGHLVHDLVDEGKAVAAAAGIELHEDPWEMNVLATRRGSAHYPSMLEDVEAHRATEIDLITGSLVREAERHGVPVPLHTALLRLVKAKEESWTENVHTHAPGGVMTRRTTGALAAALATLTAIVAITAASAPAASSDPIVIGWAFDGERRHGAVRRACARGRPDPRRSR